MARQLRKQLDEEVTVIGKDDFGPSVKRPLGTPAVGTPPPSQPAPSTSAPPQTAASSPPPPAPPPEGTDEPRTPE
jgi:hypothetical protein